MNLLLFKLLPFPFRIIQRLEMGGYLVKMRNVLSYGESWKSIARLSICLIRGNGTDNLNSLRFCRIKNGTAADAVNCYSIDQVGISDLLGSANTTGEETKSIRGYCRETQPPNLNSNAEAGTDWEKWYKHLWKLKVILLKNNYS